MQKFNGIEYLKIDIANAYGMDKLTWDKRLEWYENNKNNLDSLKADEPVRAYAGRKALEQALNNEPIGFMVGLDATSSFAQMQGILLGDTRACYLSNCLDPNTRQDIYTILYNKIKAKVPNCPVNLTRENIKKVVMQFFYGGTKTPKEVLGEEIYEQFVNVMQEELELCYGLREFMLNNWDSTAREYKWILPDNFHVKVDVQATYRQDFNFKNKRYTVYFKENEPTEDGRSLGPNFIHSIDAFILREMVARCYFNQDKIDKLRKVQHSKTNFVNLTKETHKDYKAIMNLLRLGEESGYYSVRLLDFLNEKTIGLVPESIINNILDTMPEKSFELGVIHDCYLCHPNYANDLREQYRQCLINLSKSDLLQFCLRQIFNEPNFIYKKPTDLTKEIAQEEYAIC